jgi:hypothetical protein
VDVAGLNTRIHKANAWPVDAMNVATVETKADDVSARIEDRNLLRWPSPLFENATKGTLCWRRALSFDLPK